MKKFKRWAHKHDIEIAAVTIGTVMGLAVYQSAKNLRELIRSN